uniref:Uncharacterized protein n=1 Tax=Fagus sylvatica TaxID=28930 RepID=A0A2N9HJD3_FAGSY
MRGTGMVRGRRTMITLNQRMIVGGMNSPEHGHKHSDQDQDPEPFERRRSRGQYDHLDVQDDHDHYDQYHDVVMTNMIEWRMMITNMSVQHQSHVKGREQEMWSMSIDDRRGHFLGSTSTKAAGTSQVLLLLVRFIQFLFSGV